MGDTLAQLATAAQRYGYGGTDDTARLKAFINETYRDLFYKQKWSWAESLTTVTLSAGSSSVAVPTGSYQFGELRKVTTPATPELRAPAFVPFEGDGSITFVGYNVTAVGAPEEYTIFDDTFFFDRIADVTYVYQFYRWLEPTVLADGDEPLVPQYGREILQWGALMRQCLRDSNREGYALFSDLYEQRMKDLKEADIQGRPPARARMSDEYGRAYEE